MHTIHHTRAVILRRQPSREGDALFWLFTEDFGLIVAVATGIRKPGAKLVSQLIEYAVVEVDLVQGKEWWRITSAQEHLVPITARTASSAARAYVRALSVVYRFLVDEEAHPAIFAYLYEAAELVARGDAIDAKRFDTVLIWYVLVLLGYIPYEGVYTQIRDFLTHTTTEEEKKMIQEVHRALRESHL